ncbi:T9SS type A sorting domain-containing protein [candidate division WOR-3 bacterium]|nr:T9SS type A sorting domain-containing protein [candidate division WOR-3 bacterium]
MKVLIIILIFLSLISTIHTQTITWSKVYGTNAYNEIAQTIKQTQDGGYVVIGWDYQLNDYVCLIRLNEYGDSIWSKVYSDSIYNYFSYEINLDIEIGVDSGFVFYVPKIVTYDSIPMSVYWINETGAIYRNVNYYILNFDPYIIKNFPFDIDITDDDCFLIVGNTQYGDCEGFLLKINDNGDSLWVQNSATSEQFFSSVIETCDHSIIVTLNRYYNPPKTLIKFDSFGNPVNSLQSLSAFNTDIEMLSDQKYVFIDTFSGLDSIIKVDDSLQIIWVIEGDGYTNLAPCSDGGVVVTGSYNNDIFLTKFNTDGDSLWTVIYGGGGLDSGRYVEQTQDGGFIICGSTTSYGTGSSDFYIIKTDSLGYAMGVEEEPNPIITYNDGITVENISLGTVKISFVADHRSDFSLHIYDVSGREIIVPQSIGSEDGRIEIIVGNIRSGSYFYRIDTGKKTFEGKFTFF